jgi:2-polyprenyl-6-methoxyphenol hydroxylase-like FAD-dependent oxidoreductase
MSEKIVIVGSGIAGICTALALAKRGMDITILERDTPPPEGDADKAFFEWPRRGASQFRHPHAFLGLMCNLLEDNYPDLLEEFYSAGARRLDFQDMLSPELRDRYVPAPGDKKLWILLCRRATMETVLQRYAERLPNIRIINHITIDGVVADRAADGSLCVRGLKIRRDCVEAFGEVFPADVVIDASGRTTRFPRYFEELGVTVGEENHDAEIIYYTRHYQLRDGVEEPPRGGKDRSAGDLGYLKFGVFPGDAGSFALIVCLHKNEKALREAIKDGDTFDTVCRAIPGLQPWIAQDKATATTHPFGIGDIRAMWRHYVEDGKPLARNFFAVGDAAMRTNPLYGRGCSTSILHAHILAEILDDETDSVKRAIEFDLRSEDELRPIYETSLNEDRNGIKRALASAEGRLLEKPDSLKKWFATAFGDALAAASRYNLRVLRGVMRTMNLLEKPGSFLADRRTRLIVFLYMLRGRSRNAVTRLVRGPSREEMLVVVERGE